MLQDAHDRCRDGSWDEIEFLYHLLKSKEVEITLRLTQNLVTTDNHLAKDKMRERITVVVKTV